MCDLRSRVWSLVSVFVVISLAAPGVLPVAASSDATLSSVALTPDAGITQGVHLRPTYHYGAELRAFNSLVGRNAGLLMYFTPWSSFDSFLLGMIQEEVPSSEVPVIVLSWEPGPSSAGCNLGYGSVGPLTAIVQGNCDGYIRAFATALKARPERFILRLAHEMNISDSPWWPGRYGNSPSQYVAMWRHVHDIFSSVGADNVEWAWSPNYASNPLNDTDYAWNDLHNYYPGSAYVDWIGLSGYNWGNPWRSFEEIYDEVLRDLTCSYAKPQLLLEVGTVEGGGGSQTKAQWLTDMYAKLPDYPFLRGVVWFNDFAYASRGQADFRVTTSTADCASNGGCVGVMPISNWTSAYAAAVARSSYVETLPSMGNATPDRVACVLDDQLMVTPDHILLEPGDKARFSVMASGVSDPLNLVVDAADEDYFKFPSSPVFLSSVSYWAEADLTVQSYITTPLKTYDFSLEVGGYSIPLSITVVDEIHRVYLPLAMQGH